MAPTYAVPGLFYSILNYDGPEKSVHENIRCFFDFSLALHEFCWVPKGWFRSFVLQNQTAIYFDHFTSNNFSVFRSFSVECNLNIIYYSYPNMMKFDQLMNSVNFELLKKLSALCGIICEAYKSSIS